ncbi:unnamed protein product [Nippostrongylus brasiliensis]|uniref:Transposase n=1 Tax=Nippostrongylus brasiliensis TaxID=27835 RepID=A0A0N4YM00_NIPBR|nr:unnamed protein product [Nippostrongylus brasiliensis]
MWAERVPGEAERTTAHEGGDDVRLSPKCIAVDDNSKNDLKLFSARNAYPHVSRYLRKVARKSSTLCVASSRSY